MRNVVVALLLVAGCDNQVQTTSGAAYRSARPEFQLTNAKVGTAIDVAVDQAADVEPILRFPARLGLARVAHGNLVAVPPQEADAWIDFAKGHADYGTFVPISPLIADMAISTSGNAVRGVADAIRLGAARQHVDAVLIYEVSGNSKDHGSVLSVLDVTVIGAFLVPSRRVDGEAVASGVLLDVRNGYPYGTVSASSGATGFVPSIGSDDRGHQLRDDAEVSAVAKLTSEVDTMLAKLRNELQTQELTTLRTRQQAANPARLMRSR